MGGTGTYAGAIWIGYDQPKDIHASSSEFSAPLWGWWMRAVHKGTDMTIEFPHQLKRKWLCAETGNYGNGSCKIIPMPILEGQRSSKKCTVEHPEPDPDKPKFESLWKRKERLKKEAEDKKRAEKERERAELERERAELERSWR